MKAFLKRVAEKVAPNYTKRFLDSRLRQHAREFAATMRSETSIEHRVDYARAHSHLRSLQKRAEIVALLKLLDADRPRLICEIGSDRGGTLALFTSVAAPHARILSIDIKYPESLARVYRLLAQPDQEVTCLEADSHSSKTVDQVRTWLNGQLLDFLFIDGDHSYQGVRSDFELFGPLVRAGGVIAFHDIVEDFRTRFGRATLNDVGQVPLYWAELKRVTQDPLELIEDPDQDGYGIGVVRAGALSRA